MTTYNRQDAQRASIRTITQPGLDAAWGLTPDTTTRETDLIMAVQMYDETQTGKLALVNELRAAVLGRFGPVAGRLILQQAGE